MRRIKDQFGRSGSCAALSGVDVPERRRVAAWCRVGIRLVCVVAIGLVLCGCGYSRMGPHTGHDAALEGVATPSPRWPDNFTQLPTLRAQLTVQSDAGPKPWMTLLTSSRTWS